MKIATIVGARPQFIKLAPVSEEIRKYHDEIIIHTGQHYDKELSQIFFNQLKIPLPDHNLNIGSGSHGHQTGKMIMMIEDLLLNIKPDMVIIYGDTNSTLSGAIASVKLHIPIGHIEAGLRNFNLSIPEEVNRVIADRLSTFLFAPTKTAVKNLRDEGIRHNVFLTGDVMYDSLLRNISIAKQNSTILSTLNLSPKDYYLATIHRQENTDNIENLKNIFQAFNLLNKQLVIPLHPRTKKEISRNHIHIGKNIRITDPVGYLDFINLQVNALKIITDSGGVQKEAYMLKIPCITIFNSTSWPETVEDGWNKLTSATVNEIVDSVHSFTPGNTHLKHFGDGHAARKILEILNK